MSRNYVLQAPRLAVAAGRMKADVNFLGIVDVQTARWMEENHVFLRDIWDNGEMTVRRLQRLYHRLFPGDRLILDMSLPEPMLLKAAAYAQERGAKVLLFVKEAESVSRSVCQAVELAVRCGVELPEWPCETITLEPGENAEAAVGALALCLMNGLKPDQAQSFYKRAAGFPDLPWYDEVAYI